MPPLKKVLESDSPAFSFFVERPVDLLGRGVLKMCMDRILKVQRSPALRIFRALHMVVLPRLHLPLA